MFRYGIIFLSPSEFSYGNLTYSHFHITCKLNVLLSAQIRLANSWYKTLERKFSSAAKKGAFLDRRLNCFTDVPASTFYTVKLLEELPEDDHVAHFIELNGSVRTLLIHFCLSQLELNT